MATIFIVDDDQAIGEMLSLVLENEGFQTVTCLDGLRAVEMFPIVKPDLILLDVMLPGLDGTEVARRIRATSNVPIIMLTAKSDTLDVVAGLEAGADDYVPKPFKVAELLARIHARFRIAKPAAEDGATGGASGGNANVNHLERGSIVIDRLEHTATKDGKDLNLTPMEFELLFMLAAAPARPSVVPACSRMSGDTRIQAIRAWSMCMFNALGPKWRTTPRTRKSCRPYVASATSSSLLNNEPAPSIQPQTLAAPRTR